MLRRKVNCKRREPELKKAQDAELFLLHSVPCIYWFATQCCTTQLVNYHLLNLMPNAYGNCSTLVMSL